METPVNNTLVAITDQNNLKITEAIENKEKETGLKYSKKNFVNSVLSKHFEKENNTFAFGD